MITITTNAADIAEALRGRVERDLPKAIAIALTRTAKAAKADEEREMRDVFDRPTPYTMSGIYYTPATPDNLVATVGVKNDSGKGIPATKYLRPQVFGGTRNLKRLELALRSIGVLPAGMFIVPGSGAKMDAYGNMDRGQIVRILSYFRAFPEAGYRANMTPTRKRNLARGKKGQPGIAYFVGRPGRLPLGIWQRINTHPSRVTPIMIFVSRANYEPTFDFHDVARRSFQRNFYRLLRDATLPAPSPRLGGTLAA